MVDPLIKTIGEKKSQHVDCMLNKKKGRAPPPWHLPKLRWVNRIVERNVNCKGSSLLRYAEPSRSEAPYYTLLPYNFLTYRQTSPLTK